MLTIVGQCHCGNLQHTLTLAEHIKHLSVLMCSCSYCRLHSPQWLGKPVLACHLRAEQASEFKPYRLASPSVDYVLCSHCGVLMSSVTWIDQHLYMAVNAATLILPSQVEIDQDQWVAMGESEEWRRERRRQSWISEVTLSTGLKDRLSPR